MHSVSHIDESPRPVGQGPSGLPAEPAFFPADVLSGAIICTGTQSGYPIRFVNDIFLSLLGYTREEFRAATQGLYARCIHPDDLARVEEHIRAALAASDRCTVSYRALDRAGRTVWLRDSSRLVTEAGGQQILVCLCTDITDIIALQQELEDSRNAYAELTGSLPCGICRTLDNKDLTILYANEAYYEMLGYTSEEAAAAGFTSGRAVLPDDQLDVIHAATRESARSGRLHYEIELRHLHRSGRPLYLLAHCRYLPALGQISTALVDITARKITEEQLRISEEQFRIAAEQSANMVLRYDIATGTAYQTSAAAAEFGIPAIFENVPESFLAAGCVDPESAPVYFSFYDSIRRGLPKGSCEVHLRSADGVFRWYHGEFTSVFQADGTPFQAIISFSDCTEQREKQLAYDKWQNTVSEMIATSTIYAEFNLTRDLCEREEGNPAYLLAGHASRSLTEMTACLAQYYIHSEDSAVFRTFFGRERLLTCFYSGVISDRLDCRIISGDDNYRWFRAEVQMVQYPYSTDVKAYVLFRDIDDEKRRELHLRQLSTTDALTGALNRAAFIEQTQALLSQESSGSHAFAMIDLDHFKQVNDRLGHASGDRVLREVVGDLKTALRAGDLIGRIGGDEFMLCMRGIPSDEVIDKRAELIVHLLERQVEEDVFISGSLGIAVYPQDGVSFETLYENADKALYRAKAQGRSRYVFYQAEAAGGSPAAPPGTGQSALPPQDAGPPYRGPEYGDFGRGRSCALSEELLRPSRESVLLLEAGERITLLHASEGFRLSTGFDPADGSGDGRDLFHLLHPDDRARFEERLRLAAASDDPVGFDVRILLPDRPAEYGARHVLAVRIPNGPSGSPALLAVVTDVTELVRCGRALRAEQFMLHNLMDMGALETFSVDIPARTIVFSPAALTHYALPQAALSGLPDSISRSGAIHADSLKALRALLRGMFSGVPESAAAVRIKTCGGTYTLCRLLYRSLPDADGRAHRAIGLMTPLENENDARFIFEQESRFFSLITCDLIAAARINLSHNRVEWVTIGGTDQGWAARIDTYDKVAGWLLDHMPNDEERSVLQQRLNRRAMAALAVSGTEWMSGELRVTDDNGRILWAERGVRLLSDPHTGDLYQFLYLRSIDQIKKRELALGIRPQRDATNLLFSRSSFHRLAEGILSGAREGAGRFAVMILRIGNAAELSARFGRHDMEALLLSVTRKLRAGLPNRHFAGLDNDGSILLFFDDIPDEAMLRESCTRLFNLLGNPLYHLAPIERHAVLFAGAALLPAQNADIDLLRAGAAEALSRTSASQALVILGEEETIAGSGIIPFGVPALAASSDLFAEGDPSTAEAFARCTRLLLSGGDLDTAINHVLDVIGTYYGAERTYLFQLRDDGATLDRTHEWRACGAAARPEAPEGLALDAFPPFAELFRTAKGFILHDVPAPAARRDPTVPRYTERLRSLCAVPLIHRQSVRGLIGVENPSLRAESLALPTFVSYFVISKLFAHRSAARQSYLSSHDLLTGALTRSRFLELAERSKTQPFSSVGVLLADVDALQTLNRDYGSAYGDKAIVKLSRTLQTHLGEEHVHRFAGGTLLAVCPDIAYEAFLARVDAARTDLNQNADFGVSFGYTWSDTTSDIEKLTQDADELMHAQKREGGKAEDARRGAFRSKILRNLEKNIRNGDVLAYLQPKVRVEGGALSGAEALARIRQPGHGLILPGQFIPRLEGLGLVRYADLHILGEVCQLLSRWRDAGKPLFPISINFSRATVLEPGIVHTALEIVDRHRLDHSLIEIEITETLGEFEWTTVAEIGKKLRSAGFRLALDDFGARYSNLSIIAALDFSSIKLDKSLVDRLLSSEKIRALVGTVIDVAARLGMETVAEGVETAEQLSVLRQLKCAEIQGYLINKPLPADEFEAAYL